MNVISEKTLIIVLSIFALNLWQNIPLSKCNKKFQFRPRIFSEEAADVVLRQRHRVPEPVIDYVVDKIGHLLQHKTKRNQPLSPRDQVLKYRFPSLFAVDTFHHFTLRILKSQIKRPFWLENCHFGPFLSMWISKFAFKKSANNVGSLYCQTPL